MDYPVQELHFLDLSDADKEECNFLQTTLFTINPILKYPELPWLKHTEIPYTPTEWRPAPYAVAPIPHPSLGGVFLPSPMFVPAPPAMGIVPTVAASGEPLGSSVNATSSVEGDNSDSVVLNISSPASHHISDVSQESQAGSSSHTANSVYPDATVLPVPPQVPTSIPTQSQPPVMTTMYHQIGLSGGLPLSNVYVGNMTANVNVHGYVGAPPMSPYPHHIPPTLTSQQVFSNDIPHDSSTPVIRNGGRDSRRGRPGKMGNKRTDGQYGDRNSVNRHSQDVIPTQPPLVESPPTGNSNIPQGYQIISVSPIHHPYQSHTYYNPPPASHLSHHQSVQNATGTPIYLPTHPTMYPPPMYSAYPHHQTPVAPGIMAFASIPSAPVPTTETSVLGSYQMEMSGTEDQMSVPPPALPINKDIELEQTVEQQKTANCSVQQVVCTNSYQPEPLSEVLSNNSNNESVVSEHSNIRPTSYHQQQSEEEEYNQANIVDTVVVNNSNIITESHPFTDSKECIVESVNRNVSRISEGMPQKYVTSKVRESVVNNISLNQTNVSVSDSSCKASAMVNNMDLKKEKTSNSIDIFPSSVQQEKCIFNETKSISCDASTSAISKSGPVTDSVIVNNPHLVNTSVLQNLPLLPSASHSLSSEVSTPTQISTRDPSKPGRSWAGLFRKASSGSTADGMLMTGTSSVNSCSTKPLACVKPMQSPDISSRVSNVSSAANSLASRNFGIANLSEDNVKRYSELPDDPHLYQLGEFLSNYQLEHKALSLQPRGLTNRSNWCYINSTLQALLACPPFYNLMKALPVPRTRSGKSKTPIIDSMIQFINEFIPMSAASRIRDRKEKALRKDEGNTEVQCGTAFEPTYIYKMLNSIRSDTFKVEGRQEDAEEFLGCLLNALNDEMLELIKQVKEPSKTTLSNGDIATNGDSSLQSQDEDDSLAEWKVMGPKNKGSVTRRADFGKTPISAIFRGHLRSRVQRAGDQSSDNVQPFFTLQLDIEKAQSVKEALDILAGKDQLEGVTCSRTNQEVEAWQQVTLEELPLVLLLHLKCFDYKIDGASKIVKPVDFPIDLKVEQKLLSSNKKYSPKQRQYKLFAVVYHDGKEATKGHYITDVFHVGYGCWVRYDDNIVRSVQENNVLHPRGPRVPYLLYYRRNDTIGIIPNTPVPDKSR